MFDLIRMYDAIIDCKKKLDDWKMNGYDTPIITWSEQLEIYQERLDRLIRIAEKMLARRNLPNTL